MCVADHLPTELDDATVVERDLLDAAADPVAGFEYENIGSARHEITGRRQAGQPGPEYDEVVRHCEIS